MITWNRLEYVKKSTANLLADPSDFRLFIWDNGSKDGTADYIASLADDRIVEKHFCPVNILQGFPTQWFLERSSSPVVGKIDDDTLAPHHWIDTIGDAVSRHGEFAMIGCWTYWGDDFERNREKAMKKVVTIGGHQVIHNKHIGGSAFLVRKELALKYFMKNHNGREFPINRVKMTEDGLISGWYFPLLVAEHMDDPRSKHCLMNRPGGMDGQAALTARSRGIGTPAAYQQWIMKDADLAMSTSVSRQMKMYYKNTGKKNTFLGKMKSAIKGSLKKSSPD